MGILSKEIRQYGNDHTISVFRRFGEKTKELRESKAMESEGTYRKTIRQLGKDLIIAKKDLERLQMKHLVSNNGKSSFAKVSDSVTKEELEEASLRLTLARKIMEDFGIDRSNIDMLIR